MNTKLVVWQKREGRDEEVKKRFWTLKVQDDKLMLAEIPENASVKTLNRISGIMLALALFALFLGTFFNNKFMRTYLSLTFLGLYTLFYFVVVKDKGTILVKRPNNFKKGDTVIPEIAGTQIIGVKMDEVGGNKSIP